MRLSKLLFMFVFLVFVSFVSADWVRYSSSNFTTGGMTVVNQLFFCNGTQCVVNGSGGSGNITGGNCGFGYVMQNISTLGVPQCVLDQTGGGSADGNNYTTGMFISGTTTKNLSLTRNGILTNLSVQWTDISGGSGTVTQIDTGIGIDKTVITSTGTISVNFTDVVNRVGNWSNDSSKYNTTSQLNTLYNYTQILTDINASKLNITDQRFNYTQIITDINTSKLNITDQRYNNTYLINALNATKGNIGNCGAGQVIQNITNNTIQCVLDQTSVGAGYGTIQEESADLQQRPKLNFVGSAITCIDDATLAVTNCTVTGGSASNNIQGNANITNLSLYTDGTNTILTLPTNGYLQINDTTDGFAWFTQNDNLILGDNYRNSSSVLDVRGAIRFDTGDLLITDRKQLRNSTGGDVIFYNKVYPVSDITIDAGIMSNGDIEDPMFRTGISTNLLSWTETYSNAVWFKYNTSIGSATVLSPAGLATSHLIRGNTSTTILGQNHTTTLNGTYIFSCYLKTVNQTYGLVGLNVETNYTPDGVYGENITWYNISNVTWNRFKVVKFINETHSNIKVKVYANNTNYSIDFCQLEYNTSRGSPSPYYQVTTTSEVTTPTGFTRTPYPFTSSTLTTGAITGLSTLTVSGTISSTVYVSQGTTADGLNLINGNGANSNGANAMRIRFGGYYNNTQYSIPSNFFIENWNWGATTYVNKTSLKFYQAWNGSTTVLANFFYLDVINGTGQTTMYSPLVLNDTMPPCTNNFDGTISNNKTAHRPMWCNSTQWLFLNLSTT